VDTVGTRGPTQADPPRDGQPRSLLATHRTVWNMKNLRNVFEINLSGICLHPSLAHMPAPAIDHYAVLGLAYGATPEDIKKAHKKLALKYLLLPV